MHIDKSRSTVGPAMSLDCLFYIIQYLKSDSDKSFTINEKQFLFALRSRMIDVKSNYKSGQKDLLCRACHKTEERQDHLLECLALKENDLVDDPPNYEDIFGTKLEKMMITSRILRRKYKLLTTINTRSGSSATIL